MEELIFNRSDGSFKDTLEANGMFECRNCGKAIFIDCDDGFPPCPVCDNTSYIKAARASNASLDVKSK